MCNGALVGRKEQLTFYLPYPQGVAVTAQNPRIHQLGHCMLRKHLTVLGLKINDRYRFCAETEGTPEYLQTSADAFIRKWIRCP